ESSVTYQINEDGCPCFAAGRTKKVGVVNGGRIPWQVFSVVNGGHDPGKCVGLVSSRGGALCGGIEFRREYVEALLNQTRRRRIIVEGLHIQEEDSGGPIAVHEKECWFHAPLSYLHYQPLKETPKTVVGSVH
nr:kinesin-like protein KIN-14N [Tanacetum cinerariifolium]